MPTLQRPLFDATPAPQPVTGRTVLEFFAGMGLARLGFEQAGWQVLVANDLDPAKRELYEGHFGPSTYYWLEDIHTLAEQPERFPPAALAHASFPCTDLSLAGARRGIHAGESSAYWGFHKLLENLGAARPPLVLLENVTGFLTSHGGDDFRAALASLNELGYAVDAVAIDAAHFTPQSRPRLFVVGKQPGHRGEEILFDELRPTPLRPAKLLATMRKLDGIEWSIADLPDLPAYGVHRLESILELLPDDAPQWWSDERAAYLLSQMSPAHRGTADTMIAGAKTTYGCVFRRVRKSKSMAELRTDGLAGCLRTPKGGSGRQILFAAGQGGYRVRLLTPRECARLMGAGDYRLVGSLNQALFGFGDAVSVDAIRWLAENYLGKITERR